jgi:regulator of sigma D
MYVGRDMTELSMLPKNEWKKKELAYFHHSLQQMLPYLNAEGQTIYKEIIQEVEARGGMQQGEADWTHGTKITYD